MNEATLPLQKSLPCLPLERKYFPSETFKPGLDTADRQFVGHACSTSNLGLFSRRERRQADIESLQ